MRPDSRRSMSDIRTKEAAAHQRGPEAQLHRPRNEGQLCLGPRGKPREALTDHSQSTRRHGHRGAFRRFLRAQKNQRIIHSRAKDFQKRRFRDLSIDTMVLLSYKKFLFKSNLNS